MTTAADQTIRVVVWWVALSAIALVNIAIWIVSVFRLRQERAGQEQRALAWLSALFVFGCAFRSFLPRVEALRYCLLDGWISSATWGRSVATIAELSFVAQWTLVVRRWCREAGMPVARRVAALFLPVITVAEICSWYSTITTNFLGAVFEESLWACTGALTAAALATLWRRARDHHRRLFGTMLALTTSYVLFMITIDVPMYYLRWREDESARRPYLSLRAGWHDAATRWIVTRRWQDWRQEVPWMSLYFSAGVWLSLALINPPRFASDVDRSRAR